MSSNNKRVYKNRSWVWDFFEKKIDDDKKCTVCNICKISLIYYSTSSTMRTHLFN